MPVAERKSTKILSTKDLRTGLELADDVITVQGFVLATQGTTLTNKHLKAFKAWGVLEVAIAKSGDAACEDEDGGVTELDAETEVSRKFQKMNMEDAVIQELYRISVQFARNGKGVEHGRSQRPRT